MKSEKLIIKRFEELETIAQEIEATWHETDTAGWVDHDQFYKWSTSVMNLLQRVFGTEGVHYSEYQKHNPSALAGSFRRCMAIFLAAKEDYEGGFLFNIRSLLSAEIMDDVLEQAKELLRADYKDPACLLTGVTLERALKTYATKKAFHMAK